MAKDTKESRRYQDMLSEVESIVSEIGNDQLDLDVMVTKIERGYGLIREMRSRLESTKAKVEKLRVEFDQDSNRGSDA
jgi:exodeoxyribonuclease VII small subunit